jgi:hypothetical protein
MRSQSSCFLVFTSQKFCECDLWSDKFNNEVTHPIRELECVRYCKDETGKLQCTEGGNAEFLTGTNLQSFNLHYTGVKFDYFAATDVADIRSHWYCRLA